MFKIALNGFIASCFFLLTICLGQYQSESIQYFELIDESLALGEMEQDYLKRNNFVVSDRQAWSRFLDAYAWLYWQDLPVLITTDSLLHAMHQSYADIFTDIEFNLLAPQMHILLSETLEQLEQAKDQNTELKPLYEDVALYLKVAIALLDWNEYWNTGLPSYFFESTHPLYPEEVQKYLNFAKQVSQVKEINLFAQKKDIDFTLFKPRGRYASSEQLSSYFRMMSWLAHIDFRYIEVDPITGKLILHKKAIAASLFLYEAMEAAGTLERWQEVEALLSTLVGESDNLTLVELPPLLAEVGLYTANAVLESDPQSLINLFTEHSEAQQRISGQIFYRHSANAADTPVNRPVSLALMGQRFVIDSFVLGELVFDRLIVDDKPVMRALPQPLDVMVALGNERARAHLDDELTNYGYEAKLNDLQEDISSYPETFWQQPIYNQWLNLIRLLDTSTNFENYPKAMQNLKWQDKMLQSQLASWTQLRHDHLLYAKQSFTTGGIVCFFPDWYIEPYPEFYAAYGDFAATLQNVVGQLQIRNNPWGDRIKNNVIKYTERVQEVSVVLEQLAKKTLKNEPFTSAEEDFIQNTVIYHVDDRGGGLCGVPRFDTSWDGWYRDLFYDDDDKAALIADIHTNPTSDSRHPLYPPRVLHVATGHVSPMFFIADKGDGPSLFVGPVFSYYEVIEKGNASQLPKRYTNDEWHKRLEAKDYPIAPAWTESFRVSTNAPPDQLRLLEKPDECMYLEYSPFTAVRVSEVGNNEYGYLQINDANLEHTLSFEEGKLELNQAGEIRRGNYECRKGEVIVYMYDLPDQTIELSLDLNSYSTGVIVFQGQYYANPERVDR